MFMKKYLYIFALVVACATTVYAQDTIRVMTINIHQGSDTTLQAIGEFIKQCNPDLVALQEVDMWPKRPEAPKQKGKNFIAELSYHSNLMGYFGKAWDHPGGWLYGDGILSKYPVNKIDNILLPHDKTKSGSEPRTLIIAHLTINGQDILFASTHLCHKYKENRMAQMQKIRKSLRFQKEKIKILCGDMNSHPSENVVSGVMTKWHDVLPDNTFPSNGKAYAKYDYILIENKADLEVVNTFFMCDYGITDHCACVADIVIPKKQ